MRFTTAAVRTFDRTAARWGLAPVSDPPGPGPSLSWAE